MKAVNVDDVLKILYDYGRYVFAGDEKRYSSMVDEIANLPALKSSENPNKWTPVSEQPPEESGVYLVFITNRLGYPQMEVDGFVHEKWERFGNNVIAWMPLPGPYEEETNE